MLKKQYARLGVPRRNALALTLSLALLLSLLYAGMTWASPSIEFTTNGNAENYGAGATLLIYGQITNNSYPLADASLTINVKLANESIYEHAVKSNSDGYFSTKFNLPNTVQVGQRIDFTITYAAGEASTSDYVDVKPHRSINYYGASFPAYFDKSKISKTVALNNFKDFRLMFQGNVNYFNNRSNVWNLDTLGPNTRNEDCVKVYEDSTNSRINTRVNLIRSGGAIEPVYYFDKNTLEQKSTTLRDSLRVSITDNLKADTVYKVVISHELSNNSSGSLDTDQVIYVKTSPNYKITLNQPSAGGKISTTPSGEAAAGEKVKLSIELENGYSLTGWNVSHSIELDKLANAQDNSFDMPADNVTIGATLSKDSTPAPEPDPDNPAPDNPDPDNLNGGTSSRSGSSGSGGKISGTGTGPAPSTLNLLDPEVPLAQGTPDFADVPESHWAYQYIMYLAGNGFVKGKTETSFAPDETITRAEFVTILARMSGDTLPAAYSGSFTDIFSGSFYEQAVAWGVSAGLINGTSELTFSPDDPILRQQMAALIVRYAAYRDVNFLQYNEAIDFADSEEIDDYAYDSVSVMQQADLINGYEDGTFRPLNEATRAETAKVLALFHYLMRE